MSNNDSRPLYSSVPFIPPALQLGKRLQTCAISTRPLAIAGTRLSFKNRWSWTVSDGST